MIEIKDKHNCCGCAACVQKCARQCISLLEDSEGFLYPVIDTEKCIDCGLCETVCPELNQYDKQSPLTTLAAINIDECVRLESSSGGVFSLLAEQTIKDGGVVFGARFDEKWEVVIDCSDTLEGIAQFRGSKYLQARTEDSFFRCEQFLKKGRRVLYSGTPCQVAGLKHFLGKEYRNLFTVDVVCHGVPSPKVWRKYLDETVGVSNVKGVSMRDKVEGWQNYHLSISYVDGDKSRILSSPYGKNDYMRAFLKDMILRPSCYRCKSRELRSGSDITIGDYWGIDDVCPEMNDDKGICLVLANTEKGKSILESDGMKFKETSFEEGYRGNPSICRSPMPWIRRKQFFEYLDSDKSVVRIIRDCLKPTFRMRLNDLYYKIKCKLKSAFVL